MNEDDVLKVNVMNRIYKQPMLFLDCKLYPDAIIYFAGTKTCHPMDDTNVPCAISARRGDIEGRAKRGETTRRRKDYSRQGAPVCISEVH